MPEDTMFVAPSAENGNIPVDAPSEPATEPAAPAVEPKETTEPVVPTEPTLYELPDGRKVDAETLATEFRENFLPEFTRKSQELSALKNPPITNPTPPTNPYADPNYVPQTYEEIIAEAERRALDKFEGKQKAEAELQQTIEQEVANQLTEVKKADSKIDENALFLHATKYGFRDLRVAYQNMKDMNLIAKKVEQTTVKNITKRADPVSTANGQPNGTQPDPRAFGSARDYLRSLNK